MNLFNIKKVAFASALAAGSVFAVGASAQANLLNGVTYTIATPAGSSYTTSSGTYSSGSSLLLPSYSSPYVASISFNVGALSLATGTYTLSFNFSGASTTIAPFAGSCGVGGCPTGISIFFRDGSNYIGQAVSTATPVSTSSTNTYSIAVTNPSSSTSLRFYNFSSSAYTFTDIVLLGYSGVLLAPSGPSAADTQVSLQNTAAGLRSTYALQNSVVANSLNYDCQVFDKNDVCVSAGGRNTNVQAGGVNNVSALLIAAYRAMPEVRLGAYLDQNLSVTTANSPVNMGNGGPLFGLFGVWNQNPDGTETEVKVSAAFGQKNATMTRAIVGTSEAGTGSSTLNNTGVQAIAKYGFAVTKDAMVSPYIGLRYTQGNMGSYVEATSAAVTTPLTYAALNTNATTFMAGVHGKYRLTPEATVQASVGLESDTNVNNGSLTATGITGLTAINFNPNPVKTRPVAMLGAYYDVEKNQRVAVTGIYRQEPFQAVGSTTALATYTVGF